MKFSYFLAIILILTVSGYAGAQNVPTVSQIKTETRNNLVRITWTDSPDARGSVFIFRSTRPFIDSIPPNIRPIVVPYGTQSYIDDSEDMESLHYFIAASEINGRRYDTIIPNRNSISVSLRITDEKVPSAILSAIIEDEDAYRSPGIYSIMARQEGEGVVVTYTIIGEQRNVVIFRSTQPIREPIDLVNAVIIYSGTNPAFLDLPLPGVPLYYAAIKEDEILSGRIEIRPNQNTTTTSLTLFEDDDIVDFFRPIPLPYLSLGSSENQDSGILPPRVALRPETIRALESVDTSRVSLEKKSPSVFSIDLKEPATGEESAMIQIVQDYFIKHDWENARIMFQHYLSLPRNQNVEARTRFYLGQTLYFTGKYREALFEFLTIQSFHSEIQSWIDASLAALVN